MSPEVRSLRIVLDTDVFFSALALPRNSPPSKVLDLARTGRIEVFASLWILEELERNLLKKASWTQEQVLNLRKKLKVLVSLVEPTIRVKVTQGVVADNRILECALEAGADVLVTGDGKHLRPLGAFQGIEILSPREFLEKYSPGMG